MQLLVNVPLYPRCNCQQQIKLER